MLKAIELNNKLHKAVSNKEDNNLEIFTLLKKFFGVLCRGIVTSQECTHKAKFFYAKYFLN